VRKGRYVVHRRGGGKSGAAQISVSDGESRELTDADFQSFPEEKLATKGGAILFHPHELGLSYALLVSGLLSPFEHGPALHYAYRTEDWTFGARASLGFGSRETATATETSRRWEGAVLVDRVFASWFRIGVGPAIAFYDRRFDSHDAQRLELAGYRTSETQRTVLGGAALEARMRVPLGDRFWFAADIRGSAFVGKLDDVLRVYTYGGGGLGAGFDL
jgi:hypothetical protein